MIETLDGVGPGLAVGRKPDGAVGEQSPFCRAVCICAFQQGVNTAEFVSQLVTVVALQSIDGGVRVVLITGNEQFHEDRIRLRLPIADSLHLTASLSEAGHAVARRGHPQTVRIPKGLQLGFDASLVKGHALQQVCFTRLCHPEEGMTVGPPAVFLQLIVEYLRIT